MVNTALKLKKYEQLSIKKSQTKGRYIIGGDFNARLHYVGEHEKIVAHISLVGEVTIWRIWATL